MILTVKINSELLHIGYQHIITSMNNNYQNRITTIFCQTYLIHNNTKENIDIIDNLDEAKPDLSYIERWIDFHLYMKHSISDGKTFNVL